MEYLCVAAENARLDALQGFQGGYGGLLPPVETQARGFIQRAQQ